MKNVAIALTLLVGLVGTVNANGNADAGKAKASTVCMACHGTDGNAPIAMYPKLAGQHADYLVKQLKDFKSGARKDPIMAGMAAALSEQDMLDLGAYYQSQQVTDGTTPENVVAIAKPLYQGGDMERNIAACIACHGPRGNGSGLAKFPKIASQNADYIANQLKKFRSGERANDPSGMMVDTAKKLTDAEIDALSKYLGGLH